MSAKAARSFLFNVIVCMTVACDAEVLETETWQCAIDEVSRSGGGRVVVPPGRHVVGELYLRNDVELHLSEGAVLEGAKGLHNYVIHQLPYSEGTWCAVVLGLNVTNVAITGKGEVFGNGASFETVRAVDCCREGFRPRGIVFADAKGIRLEDFKLRDAAGWGIVFKRCDGVTARRIRIDSVANHNNDGFDIEAKNVLIEECDLNCGDDGYCVKSNDPDYIVENILVRNCRVGSHCNALKIGTATHGTIRNVRFEHCRVVAPTRVYRDLKPMPKDLSRFYPIKGVPDYLVGPGISAVCIECVDGGTVESIVVDDVEFDGVQVPIFVRGGTRTKRACGIPPSNRHVLRNIVISNVRGRAEQEVPSSISGVVGCRPKNVMLRDIEVVCRGAGITEEAFRIPGEETAKRYPEATMFRHYRLPGFGLFIDQADDVCLENVRFSLAHGTSDNRNAIYRTEN